ncbi:MAG: hypothetical protein IPO27_02800 [Bacteroidetes bacterium]|nr:hypothetical protein [Bacteroidota bacterium]
MSHQIYYFRHCIFYAILLLAGCKSNPLEIDVSQITSEAVIKQLDNDLFKQDSITYDTLSELRANYKDFFDIYCNRMLRLPIKNDTILLDALNKFISDRDVKTIKSKTDSAFSQMDDIQAQLTDFVKHYTYYYPQKPVPNFISYISAFNYATVTVDSSIGIGLDFYLGADCEFYPSLQFPNFMIRKLSRQYIAPNCITGYFQKEYPQDLAKNQCMDYMIYYGKMWYYLQAMAPSMPDSIRFGYSQTEVEFAAKNEKNIWAAMIENKLLFSTDYKTFMKLISDGPTTSGFPEGSPPRLGCYIGYKIIVAYLKNNKDITLTQLMSNTDHLKIFNQSGYKP